jgi:hypothetical protein
MKKEIQFSGIVSGDGESFCFDVDRETFVRITGNEPNEFDISCYNNSLFRLYPNDIFGYNHKKVRIHVILESE